MNSNSSIKYNRVCRHGTMYFRVDLGQIEPYIQCYGWKLQSMALWVCSTGGWGHRFGCSIGV